MRRTLFFALLLSACAASAELKRSSRNLESLTKRSSGAASARSGETGLNVVQPPRTAPAAETTTFSGPKKGWGFVRERVPYYSSQGKNLGKLAAGALFKYADVKTTSKNPMLLATVKRGEAWEGPFLLDCTAVIVFENEPDAVDAATLKDLETYFTLAGSVADRKEALEEKALSANPHYASARQSQQTYQSSVAKAAEMERQALKLSGSAKAKADEALRALKYEQVRLKAKADADALAYKAWKDKHPVDPASFASDPQLQALARDLAAAKSKVEAMLPPAK